MFNDPFYKQDRSQKNLNKVVAAKRRKRDGTGKFNFEAGMTESDIEVDIGRLKTIAASLLTGLGLNNNPQVAYHSFRH